MHAFSTLVVEVGRQEYRAGHVLSNKIEGDKETSGQFNNDEDVSRSLKLSPLEPRREKLARPAVASGFHGCSSAGSVLSAQSSQTCRIGATAISTSYLALYTLLPASRIESKGGHPKDFCIYLCTRSIFRDSRDLGDMHCWQHASKVRWSLIREDTSSLSN